MSDPDNDADALRYSQHDIDTLVGIQELRGLLSAGRDHLLTRSYAEFVASRKGFPEPLITYPREGRIHMRLWLLRDVEKWLEGFEPRRGRPPKN